MRKATAARTIFSSSPSANTTRFGFGAHAFHDGVERVGGGVEAAGQFAGVAAQVGDRLAGDAAVHGGAGDGGGQAADQARVEGVGDDVFRAELQALAGAGGVTSSGTSSRASMASASAAAIFIASLMVLARTSSAPRKM